MQEVEDEEARRKAKVFGGVLRAAELMHGSRSFSATAGFCMINGHEIVAAVILGGLAGAAALEAFFDVCFKAIHLPR